MLRENKGIYVTDLDLYIPPTKVKTFFEILEEVIDKVLEEKGYDIGETTSRDVFCYEK